MDVSGIGGMGIGTGAAMGPGTGAASTTGTTSTSTSSPINSPATLDAQAKSAPAPESIAEYYQGALSPNLQELVNQMEGFSTAELLIAMMMLAAGKKEDEQSSNGSSSAFGFLAGLAMGQQLSQSSPLMNSPMPDAVSPATPAGGILDINV